MERNSTPPETRKKIIHTRQKISELKANQPIQRLELVLLRIYPQRMVYSEHYVGPVAAACGRDETGLVGVVLWGEQIQRVQVGDIVSFESGWCRERKGELVVSTGRNGRLSLLGR
jgi:ssDNA-binding replication factor A large subunit